MKALLHRTDERVSADQTLFFLHLLGLDTNGHGHKPHSRQYVDNIRVVDEGIRRTVELFERRFPDNKWVLPGMSDPAGPPSCSRPTTA